MPNYLLAYNRFQQYSNSSNKAPTNVGIEGGGTSSNTKPHYKPPASLQNKQNNTRYVQAHHKQFLKIARPQPFQHQQQQQTKQQIYPFQQPRRPLASRVLQFTTPSPPQIGVAVQSETRINGLVKLSQLFQRFQYQNKQSTQIHGTGSQSNMTSSSSVILHASCNGLSIQWEKGELSAESGPSMTSLGNGIYEGNDHFDTKSNTYLSKPLNNIRNKIKNFKFNKGGAKGNNKSLLSTHNLLMPPQQQMMFQEQQTTKFIFNPKTYQTQGISQQSQGLGSNALSPHKNNKISSFKDTFRQYEQKSNRSNKSNNTSNRMLSNRSSGQYSSSGRCRSNSGQKDHNNSLLLNNNGFNSNRSDAKQSTGVPKFLTQQNQLKKYGSQGHTMSNQQNGYSNFRKNITKEHRTSQNLNQPQKGPQFSFQSNHKKFNANSGSKKLGDHQWRDSSKLQTKNEQIQEFKLNLDSNLNPNPNHHLNSQFDPIYNPYPSTGINNLHTIQQVQQSIRSIKLPQIANLQSSISHKISQQFEEIKEKMLKQLLLNESRVVAGSRVVEQSLAASIASTASRQQNGSNINGTVDREALNKIIQEIHLAAENVVSKYQQKQRQQKELKRKQRKQSNQRELKIQQQKQQQKQQKQRYQQQQKKKLEQQQMKQKQKQKPKQFINNIPIPTLTTKQFTTMAPITTTTNSNPKPTFSYSNKSIPEPLQKDKPQGSELLMQTVNINGHSHSRHMSPRSIQNQQQSQSQSSFKNSTSNVNNIPSSQYSPSLTRINSQTSGNEKSPPPPLHSQPQARQLASPTAMAAYSISNTAMPSAFSLSSNKNLNNQILGSGNAVGGNPNPNHNPNPTSNSNLNIRLPTTVTENGTSIIKCSKQLSISSINEDALQRQSKKQDQDYLLVNCNKKRSASNDKHQDQGQGSFANPFIPTTNPNHDSMKRQVEAINRYTFVKKNNVINSDSGIKDRIASGVGDIKLGGNGKGTKVGSCQNLNLKSSNHGSAESREREKKRANNLIPSLSPSSVPHDITDSANHRTNNMIHIPPFTTTPKHQYQLPHPPKRLGSTQRPTSLPPLPAPQVLPTATAALSPITIPYRHNPVPSQLNPSMYEVTEHPRKTVGPQGNLSTEYTVKYNVKILNGNENENQGNTVKMEKYGSSQLAKRATTTGQQQFIPTSPPSHHNTATEHSSSSFTSATRSVSPLRSQRKPTQVVRLSPFKFRKKEEVLSEMVKNQFIPRESESILLSSRKEGNGATGGNQQ